MASKPTALIELPELTTAQADALRTFLVKLLRRKGRLGQARAIDVAVNIVAQFGLRAYG